MFSKQWTVIWQGHEIIVNNWWNLLLFGGEELIIDGKTVDKHQGWLNLANNLNGTIILNQQEYQVKIHLGSIDFGFRIGCQIFVNDNLIGGDIDKIFLS